MNHVWAVGIALSLLSPFGCGGKVEGDSSSDPPFAGAPSNVPAARPPAASAPAPPRLGPPQPTPSPPRPAERAPQISDDYRSLPADVALNVLMANCGQCHGPALLQGQAGGGINFFDDLDRLLDAGLLLPLNSAASPIVIAMRDGSMPPPASGLPQVTEADINAVTQWLDNPRYWPDYQPPPLIDAGVDVPVLVDAGADGG